MNPPIEDLVEVRQLSAIWALRLTQGDIHPVMEHVFTADGTYSAFGQTYGLEDWGEVPLIFVDQTNHHMRMGWYTDTYERTADGWRLKTRKMTFLRRHGGADSGKPHDPLGLEPTSTA